jgi:hypothetical protein
MIDSIVAACFIVILCLPLLLVVGHIVEDV